MREQHADRKPKETGDNRRDPGLLFDLALDLLTGGGGLTAPFLTDFNGLIGEFPNWLKPETGVIKAVVTVP